MTKKIEVLMDNGGGLQLQTAKHCHSYESSRMAEQCATDIQEFLRSGDTSGWDGMTARQYKQELGIFLKIPLTDPDVEEVQSRNNRRTLDTERFLRLGAPTRFIPGQEHPHYVSRQFREQVAARNKLLKGTKHSHVEPSPSNEATNSGEAKASKANEDLKARQGSVVE
jgi:hypothetical protein